MDPVVGEPPLWEIIGADSFGAIAGTNLGAPIRGALGVAFLALRVVDLGTQERHGAGAVLVLRTLVLHEDNRGRRQMGDADRGFGLVDMLAAGALRAHRIDLQVRFVDIDVDFLGFGQHRDGRRRRMNAALRLGFRHALDSMHARLEF